MKLSATNNYLKVSGRFPKESQEFFFEDRDEVSRARAWAEAVRVTGPDEHERIFVWHRVWPLSPIPDTVREVGSPFPREW